MIDNFINFKFNLFIYNSNFIISIKHKINEGECLAPCCISNNSRKNLPKGECELSLQQSDIQRNLLDSRALPKKLVLRILKQQDRTYNVQSLSQLLLNFLSIIFEVKVHKLLKT